MQVKVTIWYHCLPIRIVKKKKKDKQGRKRQYWQEYKTIKTSICCYNLNWYNHCLENLLKLNVCLLGIYCIYQKWLPIFTKMHIVLVIAALSLIDPKWKVCKHPSRIELLSRNSCNPSYSGGRDWEDCHLKPAQAKNGRGPSSTTSQVSWYVSVIPATWETCR
jgi:hypothetical protein